MLDKEPIKTNRILPTEINKYYERKLLYGYVPKLYDDSSDLWKIFEYIETKLAKKARYNGNRLEKYVKSTQDFIKLYELITQKEKDLEGTPQHPSQRPFNYFNYTYRNGRRIFEKVKRKANRF